MMRRVPLLALCAVLCGASAAQAQAVLPLFSNKTGGPPQFVEISVGGGRTAPVSVDTGSVGLYVMERDVGPGVERTDVPIHQGYVDGTRFDGYVGMATVSFSSTGVATQGRVPVGIITRVFCAAEHPRCPGSASKPGVMGVGLSTAGRLPSPLVQLPGNLRPGFVYDARRGGRPHVVLGLTPEDTRGFRFTRLQPAQPGPYGLPSWDSSSVRGCYAVDERDATCQEVIFDTGQSDAVADGGALDLRLGPHGFLLPGQRFSLRVPGALDFAVETDRSMFIRPRRTSRSNIGRLIYRTVAIAFDAREGRIGFLQ